MTTKGGAKIARSREILWVAESSSEELGIETDGRLAEALLGS